MAQSVIMPRQGQSVESCVVAKWFKQKGEKVEAGDLLFSYETDKAAFDEEARVSGTLLEVFVREGDDVPVLQTVCVIGTPGEDISAFMPGGGGGESGSTGAPTGQVSDSRGSGNNELLSADGNGREDSAAAESVGIAAGVSPRARNLAVRVGANLAGASGSGPGGRIIERDVVALRDAGRMVTSAAQGFVSSAAVEGTGLRGRVTVSDAVLAAEATEGAVPTGGGNTVSPRLAIDGAVGAPATETVKVSSIRKVIAKAMFASISTTCQLTLNSSFDATDILAYRKRLKASDPELGLTKVTLNDMVAWAVSRTLPGHRDLNATFSGDEMTYFRDVHLGIATDTDRGLMVPTLFSANHLSLAEISSRIKALAAECQKGSIAPDNLKGGTFTVTNLGALGIESFTPVLNPPQTGILGVCSIVQRARETADGDYEFYPAMGLSLTFDHRAVDGAPAARFLRDLAANLERFSVLLAR